MKKINLFTIIPFSFPAIITAQPSGDEILNRIDKNMSSETRHVISKMVINGARDRQNHRSRNMVGRR
jgi:hypothetical protein